MHLRISIRWSVSPSICLSHIYSREYQSHQVKARLGRDSRIISCNLVIIQLFRHYEDASWALWALFSLSWAALQPMIIRSSRIVDIPSNLMCKRTCSANVGNAWLNSVNKRVPLLVGRLIGWSVGWLRSLCHRDNASQQRPLA